MGGMAHEQRSRNDSSRPNASSPRGVLASALRDTTPSLGDRRRVLDWTRLYVLGVTPTASPIFNGRIPATPVPTRCAPSSDLR